MEKTLSSYVSAHLLLFCMFPWITMLEITYCGVWKQLPNNGLLLIILSLSHEQLFSIFFFPQNLFSFLCFTYLYYAWFLNLIPVYFPAAEASHVFLTCVPRLKQAGRIQPAATADNSLFNMVKMIDFKKWVNSIHHFLKTFY